VIDRLRRWIRRRTRRRPWRQGGLGTIGVLVGILAVTYLAAGVAGHLATIRRSAEVPATVETRRFQVGGGTKEQLPRGWYLGYSFDVEGRRYVGAAFRTWFDVESFRPKVCYDPANPNDHLLVQGWYRCGGGDQLEP
jgi:hypothetical protein